MWRLTAPVLRLVVLPEGQVLKHFGVTLGLHDELVFCFAQAQLQVPVSIAVRVLIRPSVAVVVVPVMENVVTASM